MPHPPEWAALFSSKEHAWATPIGVVDAIAERLGLRFVLDAAALPHSKKTPLWIGPPDAPNAPGLMGRDALSMERWDVGIDFKFGDAIFLNPPYGKVIGDFVGKAKEQAQVCGVPVVVLTFIRSDTSWWHEHAFDATVWLCIKGRVAFQAPPWSDSVAAGAPAPSVAMVFTPGPGSGEVLSLPLDIPAAQRRGA